LLRLLHGSRAINYVVGHAALFVQAELGRDAALCVFGLHCATVGCVGEPCQLLLWRAPADDQTIETLV
jgi:hypothetical protein